MLVGPLFNEGLILVSFVIKVCMSSHYLQTSKEKEVSVYYTYKDKEHDQAIESFRCVFWIKWWVHITFTENVLPSKHTKTKAEGLESFETGKLQNILYQ